MVFEAIYLSDGAVEVGGETEEVGGTPEVLVGTGWQGCTSG